MLVCLRVLYLSTLLCIAAISAHAATVPLLSDNFTVSTNSTNVSIEVPGTRQTGSLSPLSYVETGTNANYSQVGRTDFLGQLFMAAKSDDNLIKVSPNANFNVSPGTNGVFYIEFDVNPVLSTVPGSSTNTTQTAWFGVKFGSGATGKTVNDADGFGILFRGEGSRKFQAFNGSTNVTPASPNDAYTTVTTDSFHSIRLELRLVTAGANLWDGSNVEIKMFVNGGVTPVFTYVKTGGFTNNFITFIAETEGTGGDGITRHALDNLKITSAPAPSVVLTSPGGDTVEPNTAFNLVATETGVTTKVEFFLDGMKIGEDTTASNGFTFSVPGQVTGTYSLSARVTDAFGLTANSAPIAIRVNSRPTVSITSPLSGVVGVFGFTPSITAVASDNDGIITKVEFFRNGKFDEDTTAGDGFGTTLPTLAPGTYTITAIATDSAGLQSLQSAPVQIIISHAPVVTLQTPSSNLTLDEPATLNLLATAYDPDSAITRVEFLANGIKIAEKLEGDLNFDASVSGLAAGIYSITAKAYDTVGLSTETTAVNVVVRSKPVFTSLPVISPTSLLAGQSVSCSANSPGSTVTWNWGDGTTSTGEIVTHLYSTPGAYNVVVTATNIFDAKVVSVIAVFVGQHAFSSGETSEEGVWGELVGGSGTNAEDGASLKLTCDYRRRDHTQLSAVLKNVEFPAGVLQSDLAGAPSILRIGLGENAIPFSFSLAANGRGKATSVKKIEVSLAKKHLAFTIGGQPALTDMIESLGGTQQFLDADPILLRLPATLQVGTRIFLALTFEIEFTGKGLKGKGVLAR